jgi:hypothetical protein
MFFRIGTSKGFEDVFEKGAYMRIDNGSGSPCPESEANFSKGMAGFVFLALNASDRRLLGCIMLNGRMVLIGLGGGSASCREGCGCDGGFRTVDWRRSCFGGVPTTCCPGEAGKAVFSTSARIDAESTLSTKEDASERSESSSSPARGSL